MSAASEPRGASVDRPAAARTGSSAGPAGREAGLADVIGDIQHALGNQVIQHRLRSDGIQRAAIDPPISDVEDPLEREAEVLAELLASGSSPGPIRRGGPAISRAPDDKKKKDAGAAPKAKPKPKGKEKPKKPGAAAPAVEATKASGEAPGGKKPEPASPRTKPEPSTPRASGRAAGSAPGPAKAQPAPGTSGASGSAGAKKSDELTPAQKLEKKGAKAAAHKETEAKKKDKKRKSDDGKAIARAHDGAGADSGPQVTPAVHAEISGAGGSGRPLPSATRSRFERGLGQDLSSVRVHDDAPAARAAGDLQAKAFTYGQDVFFGAGRFQPGSPGGSRLLAHELTHTVQQRPGAPLHRAVLQRAVQNPSSSSGPGTAAGAPAAAAAATPPTPYGAEELDPDKEGQLIVADGTVLFSKLAVPSFKFDATHRNDVYIAHRPQRYSRGYARGSPDQRSKWESQIPKQGTRARLEAKHPNLPNGQPGGNADYPYRFRAPLTAQTERDMVGDQLDVVAKQAILPTWGRRGVHERYEVDHIVELQLADWGQRGRQNTWANTPENFELLSRRANGKSGPDIQTEIRRRAEAFVTAAQTAVEPVPPSTQRTADPRIATNERALKQQYSLTFGETESNGAFPIDDSEYWTWNEVTNGDQVTQAVRVISATEVGATVADEITIFPPGIVQGTQFNAQGTPFVFLNQRQNRVRVSEEKDYLAPFEVTGKDFPGAGHVNNPVLGALTFGNLLGDQNWARTPAQTVRVMRITGLPFAGYLESQPIRIALTTLNHLALSPVRIDSGPEFLPGGGIGAKGQILPQIPPLRGVEIPFEMEGDDLTITKTFGIGDIKLPRPFIVDDVTLVAGTGTAGPKFGGQVDFRVERVGKGTLTASVSVAHGVEFAGQFDFDSKLFDPARIKINYRDEEWSGSGELGIPAGKVPGIRKGSLVVSYADDTLSAIGTAETSIPGVAEATLTASYSDALGISVGGTLTLGSDLPGITGGSLSASIAQRRTGGYSLKAHGDAQAGIPGVDATLTVDYEDGAFTAEGSAEFGYERPPITGSLMLGATNRPLDKQGNVNPTGRPTNKIVAYGSGSATITLASWLHGTVAMRILPIGEVEVTGTLDIPAPITLFDARAGGKTLFKVGASFPICGVTVPNPFGEDFDLGIIAKVDGALDFEGGVGPGQITTLGVSVRFNPDHPDDTRVAGDAKLHVPAYAGLRLSVTGGIGAEIPIIIEATASLTISGTLRFDAAVDAGVHVDWTAQRGLVLDAAADISAGVSFVFDVTGNVLVTSFGEELHAEQWNLASYPFGSGLTLGMHLPIHYEAGKPFAIAWDDVKVDQPEFKPDAMILDLASKVL